MKTSLKQAGVTLVEMLISMLILGFILTMVISVEANTLKFSTRQQDNSLQLTSLVEATGYMGDMIRQSTSFQSSLTVNGLACDVTSTTNPCFGIMVPASQGSDATNPSKIDAYLMLVYRMENRNTLPVDYKSTNSWADSNTWVIKEYRSVVCQAAGCPASGAPTVPTVINNANWYLVADQISKVRPNGTNYTPFARSTANVRQFTLQLQSVSRVMNETRYVPSTGPQSLTIMMRN